MRVDYVRVRDNWISGLHTSIGIGAKLALRMRRSLAFSKALSTAAPSAPAPIAPPPRPPRPAPPSSPPAPPPPPQSPPPADP